jgi:FKBP-type peptidyl-prolyl cis-trans isomerase FkpA
MKLKSIIFIVSSVLLFAACKKDDDDIVIVPARPLAEIVLEDDAKIQEFLAANFYNYEEFENPPVGFDYKIKIDTIGGINANKIPLSNFVQDTIIELTTAGTLGESDTKVAHKLYYLIARQGGGARPTPADSIYHKYEGALMDTISTSVGPIRTVSSVFDSTNDSFIWRDVSYNIRGFSAGIAKLNAASAITVNEDGTTSLEDSGIGMVIMPSALGYYNNINGGITAYSPLIFMLEVGLFVENTDADNDGIPSILEDLNGNGYLMDDNTNYEEELAINSIYNATIFANFQDPDDDGDGTATIDEIVINEDGTITFPDADGDGVPDYLDADTK